jgi:hypothetical protein
MITGVSLKASEAALVPLQKIADAYCPIALACKGSYNRLGSIDGIDEDENTELILEFFLKQEKSGQFVANSKYLEIHECYPIENIEMLLQGFERNINDAPNAALLNGLPVVYALICAEVWQAITKAAPKSAEKPPELFQQLFENSPIAQGIYANNLKKVAKQMRELIAVNKFLAARGLAWHPADDVEQHYSEEMTEYLKAAQLAFADNEVILKALKRYKNDVSDLLEDEDSEDED